jgi:hypothetical protein
MRRPCQPNPQVPTKPGSSAAPTIQQNRRSGAAALTNVPVEIFFNIFSRTIASANAEFTVKARDRSNPSEYQSLDMETLLALLVVDRETNFAVKQLIRGFDFFNKCRTPIRALGQSFALRLLSVGFVGTKLSSL